MLFFGQFRCICRIILISTLIFRFVAPPADQRSEETAHSLEGYISSLGKFIEEWGNLPPLHNSNSNNSSSSSNNFNNKPDLRSPDGDRDPLPNPLVPPPRPRSSGAAPSATTRRRTWCCTSSGGTPRRRPSCRSSTTRRSTRTLAFGDWTRPDFEDSFKNYCS